MLEGLGREVMTRRVNVNPYIRENIIFPLLLWLYRSFDFVLLLTYAQWYLLSFLKNNGFQIRALGFYLHLQK
jgi:hypothetical protein